VPARRDSAVGGTWVEWLYQPLVVL